jgi:hypothetical protein
MRPVTIQFLQSFKSLKASITGDFSKVLFLFWRPQLPVIANRVTSRLAGSKLQIAENTTSRQEAGSPQEGFVFCCCNQSWRPRRTCSMV